MKILALDLSDRDALRELHRAGLVAHRHDRPAAPFWGEAEVLAMICQGLTNEDITQRAFITMNTVKTHIRSLYRKMDVTTRSRAVRWGLERGFAPDRTRVLAQNGINAR